MWTTIKYIIMTAITFFILFVIFAFVLNTVKPIYHYFGRQLPDYMNTISTGLTQTMTWTSVNTILENPLTTTWWNTILTGDMSQSVFQASYQAIIDTGAGQTIIQKEFDNASDYQNFIQKQHNESDTLVVDTMLNQLSSTNLKSQDPLLDISSWEETRSTVLMDQYSKQIYLQTIQRLEFLKSFFVEHGMTSEISAIEERIRQLQTKI